MKIKSLIRATLAGLAAFLPGKSSQAELRSKKFRWTATSQERRRTSITGDLLLKDALSLIEAEDSLGGVASSERISGASQRVEGVEIRGTWTKSVLDAQGRPVFQAGETYENLPPEINAQVRAASSQDPRFAQRMREHWPFAANGHPIGAPRLQLVHEEDDRFRLEWTWSALSPDETQVHEARFDEQGRLLGEKEIGYHFADAIAKVFPRGPHMSALDEVTLQGLDDSGNLSSNRLLMRSGLETQAQASDRKFEFLPEDARFDQVSAYYYVDKILGWFQSRFAVEASTRLDVKVQVGHNSNAAYYYANMIRVGTGDGIKFSHMPRDPSVVMHEVVHSVVDRFSGLPSEGEGGGLNEAFADFLSLSFLDTPNSGEATSVSEPYTRTLKNTMQASEGLFGGTYTAARFVGGTFWDLRELLGKEAAENLAFRTLVRLGPGSRYADFVPTLRAAAEGAFSADEISRIHDVLAARGWSLDGWKN